MSNNNIVRWGGLFRVVKRVTLSNKVTYVVQRLIEEDKWQDLNFYEFVNQAIVRASNMYEHYIDTNHHPDEVIYE